jgi:hypothetical protein
MYDSIHGLGVSLSLRIFRTMPPWAVRDGNIHWGVLSCSSAHSGGAAVSGVRAPGRDTAAPPERARNPYEGISAGRLLPASGETNNRASVG